MNAHWTKRLVMAAVLLGITLAGLGGCQLLGIPDAGSPLGGLHPASDLPPQWEPEVPDSTE